MSVSVSTDNPLIAAIALLGIGLFLFWWGFKMLKREKLIEGTPTSKIRSIAMGPVEVYGEVVPVSNILLKSPLTNNDCVYYRFTIQELQQRGKHSEWVTIKSGTKSVEFFLDDGTGSVLVDANGAEIDISPNLTAEYGGLLGKGMPDSVKQFLTSNKIDFGGFLGINKQMKFTEWFIAPKEKLYIMGNAGDNPYVEEGSATKGVTDVMIQKGESEFYIADKSEQQIVGGMKWKIAGGLGGGGLMVLGGLAIIFLYLGVF
jgi:hypothetical protein